MAATAPTAAPDGEDREGLSPGQLHLLALPYGRVASWLWDFLRGDGEHEDKSTSVRE